MDRNRAQASLGGAAPPVYKDPLDVATHPLVTFETDLSEPLTPLTPEHANLLTEELRNLVVGLGWTPASDVDDQLTDAISPALVDVIIPMRPLDGQLTDGFVFSSSGSPEAVVARTTMTGADLWMFPNVPVGARIKSISARAFDDGSTETLQMELFSQQDRVATSVQLLGEGWTNSWTTRSAVLGTSHTVAADTLYFVRMFVGGSWDGTEAMIENAWLTVDLAGAPPP